MLLPPGVQTFRVDNEWGEITSIVATFGGRSLDVSGRRLDTRLLPEGVGMLVVRATDEDGDVGTLRQRDRDGHSGGTCPDGPGAGGRTPGRLERGAIR